MKVFGIETSCDETACAVVENGRIILSSVVCSQILDHSSFGGVVPEIASRRHIENIAQVAQKALDDSSLNIKDIDAIAVTYAPGLIGSLLVGVNFAKGLARYTKIPLVPVHHLKGHIAALYLDYEDLVPPFLCLIASGGHCNIVLIEDYFKLKVVSRTCDDAPGEVFDKVARALGFPYPGGIEIDELSKKGDNFKFKFPHPKVRNNRNDFSFSGLKTAVISFINSLALGDLKILKQDIAASFQETVTDVLAQKLVMISESFKITKIAAVGGVACNSSLRAKLLKISAERGLKLFIPRSILCTDNAAMIAAAGFFEGGNSVKPEDLQAVASLFI